MAGDQVRVMLWCMPRSVSTAFQVCMGNVEDVQILYEPYMTAYLVGPDIKEKPLEIVELRKAMNQMVSSSDVECDDALRSEDVSYQYVKAQLEADYPDKKVVFVKDMSHAVSDRLDMLPKGYKHAFLIRNPSKVFPSWKKVLGKFTGEDKAILKVGKNDIIPEKYFFGESLQIYEYLIKENIEPNPLIIDADDLLENPKAMLSQFCSFVGIGYTDKLLSWNGGNDVTKNWKMSKEILQWNTFGNFHKSTFQSKGFGTPTTAAPRSEMSADVLHCIDNSLPYYEKLYALRARAK